MKTNKRFAKCVALLNSMVKAVLHLNKLVTAAKYANARVGLAAPAHPCARGIPFILNITPAAHKPSTCFSQLAGVKLLEV